MTVSRFAQLKLPVGKRLMSKHHYTHRAALHALYKCTCCASCCAGIGFRTLDSFYVHEIWKCSFSANLLLFILLIMENLK